MGTILALSPASCETDAGKCETLGASVSPPHGGDSAIAQCHLPCLARGDVGTFTVLTCYPEEGPPSSRLHPAGPGAEPEPEPVPGAGEGLGRLRERRTPLCLVALSPWSPAPPPPALAWEPGRWRESRLMGPEYSLAWMDGALAGGQAGAEGTARRPRAESRQERAGQGGRGLFSPWVSGLTFPRLRSRRRAQARARRGDGGKCCLEDSPGLV